MPDRDQYQPIDPKFTHEAWLRMKATLDEEMPLSEKDRKRGFFWLWIPLFAAFLLAGALVWLNSGESSSKNAPAPLAERTEMAGNSAAAKQEASILAQSGITIPQVPQFGNTQRSISTTGKNRIKQKEPGSRENAVDPRDNYLPNKKFSVAPSSIEPEMGESKSVETALVPSKSEALKSEEKTMISPLDRRPSVAAANWQSPFSTFKPEALAILPLSLFEQNDALGNGSTSSWEQSLPSNWSRNFRWGVQLGFQTTSLSNGNGRFAGLFAEYRLDPSWLLSSGVQYHSFKFSSKSNAGQAERSRDDQGFGSVIDTTNVPVSPTRPSGEAVSDTTIYGSLVDHSRFQAIQLPLELSYRFHPKWAVSGGVQFSYILSGKSDTSVDQTLVPHKNYQKVPSGAFDLALQENIVRRWDIATHFGLDFKPTDRLKLGLDYQMVLFKNENNFQRSSLQSNNFRMSLSYYFK